MNYYCTTIDDEYIICKPSKELGKGYLEYSCPICNQKHTLCVEWCFTRGSGEFCVKCGYPIKRFKKIIKK
jgi:hypothetical protein